MNITTTALAWMCIALLVLYPLSAILVAAYLAADDNYGIMASLFAANAGAAFFVGLAFGLPEFSGHTSRVLRLSAIVIGVVCGLASALYWMADEVEHIWLRAGMVAPVLIVLLVLMWFIDKVNKERTSDERE